jgi:hypothetical protein
VKDFIIFLSNHGNRNQAQGREEKRMGRQWNALAARISMKDIRYQVIESLSDPARFRQGKDIRIQQRRN